MRNFILADNQELTRLGLETLLKEFPGSTVSIVSNENELIKKLEEDGNAVVIIDYTLFDFDSEDNLVIVGERFPKASWILISDDLGYATIKRFIYASKRISIVFKDTPLSIIREGIRLAVAGNRFICQHATELLLSDKGDGRQPMPSLTATELAVLKAIAQGRTTKEIAAERHSSIHTINAHRKNIFRKLGVNTAHEAVKKAFKAGLVDPSEFYI